MKITWVPTTVVGSGPEHFQYATSAIINDTLAIDAGSLGFYRSAEEQARIRHVIISHSHIDHVATLPIFVENAYEAKSDCVTIYGSEAVLKSCQEDLFNDRVWPDFVKLSEGNDRPFMKVQPFEPGHTIELEGLRIRAVEVNHVVPTSAFIVDDGSSTVIFTSDTGPTEEVWQIAGEYPNLKAVFLEVTFPNEMQWLADVSKHLTPATFAEETKKLSKQIRWIVVHIKARYQTQVIEELEQLDVANLETVQFGAPYTF